MNRRFTRGKQLHRHEARVVGEQAIHRLDLVRRVQQAVDEAVAFTEQTQPKPVQVLQMGAENRRVAGNRNRLAVRIVPRRVVDLIGEIDRFSALRQRVLRKPVMNHRRILNGQRVRRDARL